MYFLNIFFLNGNIFKIFAIGIWQTEFNLNKYYESPSVLLIFPAAVS